MLWKDYVWGKQTLSQLSRMCGRSIPWVQKELDVVSVPTKAQDLPEKTVVIADVTYFGKNDAALVFRSPTLKQNLYLSFVSSENTEIYEQAYVFLKQNNCHLQALVLDGRKGVREVFADIPVQMCHFHQKQILRRYLTLRPKSDAGKELLAIGNTLAKTTEKVFTEEPKDWHKKWDSYLKERTYTDEKHWNYTHKKIRSAHKSLVTNLPFLFTYQRYPELKIPHTTNSLDGFFSQMKRLLRVHSGLSQIRRNRIIQEILFCEKK